MINNRPHTTGLEKESKALLTLHKNTPGTLLVSTHYQPSSKDPIKGKTFMGIERSTFLIDAEGKIASIWRKVSVAGHVKDVLAAAKRL